MDCSLLGSSVHGISQARMLEWVAISSLGGLPNAGTEPMSPALAGGFFTTEPPGRPCRNEGKGLNLRSVCEIKEACLGDVLMEVRDRKKP